uniref:Lysosomal dipeptide transporter MFSD1 n=1 Tax=Aceria tosichella TaxID=561515 RepID=A0A6G1SPV0_9ACAR
MSLYEELINPGSALHRYLALALICLLGFGNNFCYDAPGALEAQIEDAMSIGTSQFTSLYALYSWPNVIMCFFGGLLIDRVLGIRLGSILFLTLLVIGQAFFALGAFVGEFWIMQVGRFIYGLGGESLAVAQSTYVVAWFKGRELNAVFGFQMTVSRVGSTLAFNTLHLVFNSNKALYPPRIALGYTLLIAGLTCVLSLNAALILSVLDKRAERMLGREMPQPEEAIRLKDATNFKSEFWMLTLICVSFYLTIFPFVAIGSKFFQTKWNYPQSEADAIDSVIYMISAVSSPLIGFVVDKVGRNLIFLLVSCILVLGSHMLMAVTFINQWIPMIALGIGYSIMSSSLWPLVTLVVPQQQLGTAYGVMQAIQNLGLALTANLTGILIDWKGYIFVEMFFVLWVSIALICTLLLIVQDHRRKGCLNLTTAQRRMRELHDD